MIGPFRLSILLFALGCSAADETAEKMQKPQSAAAKEKFMKKTAVPTPRPTPLPTDRPTPATCDVCPNDIRDWTNRQGLGESPGIPNLEYLGIGYNIFEGNPRGSDISEADPGFRSGVVQLVQQQSVLTVDGAYTVPLGTDVRYVTSCKFASKATELSSESEYQTEISREANQSFEANAGVNFGLGSISATYAFSKSAKYKAFTETTMATQSITYEARALCSEFQASLRPSFPHSLQETFEMALKNLPSPYAPANEEHRATYSEFFDSFGTHYVRDVTLGAKHIFSSEIKSQDVSELNRQEVDIESSLSWSVQASFGGGGGGNEDYGALIRAEGGAEIPGLGEAKIYKYVFEEAGVGGGVSSTETNSENTATSSTQKVRSKVTTVNELNVGGNPPEDGNWRSWATTVRDRPMPISYKLTGMWNLMADKQDVEAFSDAIVDIYNIDLRKKTNSTIINQLRFGVARSDGTAISSYNRDPSSNYRSSLQLTSTEGIASKPRRTSNKLVTLSDADLDATIDNDGECEAKPQWTGFLRADPAPTGEKYFACGMKTTFYGGEGITGLTIIYCQRENWLKDQQLVMHRADPGDSGSRSSDMKMCQEDEFITGVRVKADNGFGNNEGIDAIWFWCSTFPKDLTTKPIERELIAVEEGDDEGEITTEAKRPDSSYLMSGARVRSCDGLGMINIDLLFEDAYTEEKGARYEYDLSREGDAALAIFASPVRGAIGENKLEEEEKLGFSIPSRKGEVMNVMSYYPFGLWEITKSKFIIQDFKDSEINKNELQKFSFLSAENLPAEAAYIAGIVHPDGYPVNQSFEDNNIGFRVKMDDERNFRIVFSDDSMANPTFIAFPMWFPGFAREEPTRIGDVVIATKKCESGECSVRTGSKLGLSSENNLGFSFLALSGDLVTDDVSGIVHGVVTITENHSNLKPLIDDAKSMGQGFEAEASFSDGSFKDYVLGGEENENIMEFKGYRGGILIKFTKPFRGLPAVIVNPIIGDKILDLNEELVDRVAMPYAVVETITEETAFVKVNYVDSTGTDWPNGNTYEALSFHIVAVGPQRDEYSATNRLVRSAS